MAFEKNGICPRCGRPLMAYVLPSGERIFINCACKHEEKRREESAREAEGEEQEREDAVNRFLSMVGERYRNKTLANYVPDPKMRDVKHYSFIINMAKNFDEFLTTGQGGMIFGSYGCGKTHLEVALGVALSKQGYAVKLFETSSLYSRYMSAFSWKEKETPNGVIEDACNADLIILDDVGVDTLSSDKSNFEKFIFSLVNYRYNQMKPILLSTNLSPSELKALVTLRVYDRLRSMAREIMNFCPSKRPAEQQGLL